MATNPDFPPPAGALASTIVTTVSAAPVAPTIAAPAPPIAPRRDLALTPTETQAFREVFWQNVIREMLVSLIVAQSEARSEVKAPDTEPMSDGRVGLITNEGQRIPIARVFPVFALTVEQNPRLIQLSDVLQCTVFQIETPGGEVYTLPLHEIRGLHAISEKTMEQMAQKARKQRPRKNAAEEAEPFGFAAFTSVARASGASHAPEEPGPSGAD
jgi:hypothetical protein